MNTVTEAREWLAAAVTSAGLDCEPYPPDALNPPAAFVDNLNIDYSPGGGFSFCEAGSGTASIIACAQRNDRAGSTKSLEDLIKPTLDALHDLDGVRVTAVQSGSTEISGTTLPAVLYTVEFGIST